MNREARIAAGADRLRQHRVWLTPDDLGAIRIAHRLGKLGFVESKLDDARAARQREKAVTVEPPDPSKRAERPLLRRSNACRRRGRHEVPEFGLIRLRASHVLAYQQNKKPVDP